jgi:hypothetical protein
VRSAVTIADGKIAPLGIGQVQECPFRAGDGIAYIATPPASPPAVSVLPKIDGSVPIEIRAAAPTVVPEESISLGTPINFSCVLVSAEKSRLSRPRWELPPLIV